MATTLGGRALLRVLGAAAVRSTTPKVAAAGGASRARGCRHVVMSRASPVRWSRHRHQLHGAVPRRSGPRQQRSLGTFASLAGENGPPLSPTSFEGSKLLSKLAMLTYWNAGQPGFWDAEYDGAVRRCKLYRCSRGAGWQSKLQL